MSKNSCTYVPKIGKKLMNELKSQFGYETARKAFLSGAVNPKFLKDYAHSLVLDAEGVPTFESFMSIPYVRNVFIGKEKMLPSLNKNRVVLEDSIENYESLLNEAFSFNTNSPYRDSYVASVVYTEDNKLKVEISYRTNEKLKESQNEYRQFQINKRLANIFSKLGVTVGALTKVEQDAGRVGVTDFTVADQLAQDFVSMIRVANNREGAKALSEEFAHLIIGCMQDNPLIARSLNYLKSSPETLKTVLGNDYDDVVAVYEGNMDLVAEEALGHILQQNLLNTSTEKQSLFGKTLSNVRQQFKKYNEDSVDKALEEVNKMMAIIGNDALQGTLPIDREKIANSKRQVQLNALSDRVERNLEIIKNARELEVKRHRISNSKETKDWAKENIDLLNSAKEDELSQLEALANYSKRALEEMRKCSESLSYISTLAADRAFPTLRYVKGFIASYGNLIDQINSALNQDKEDEDSPVYENNPTTVELKAIVDQLAALSREITTVYTRKAHTAFCAFLKPYIGDNVVLKMKGPKGVEITVEELLNSADKDISTFDRWLDSMGDSADLLLQMFDQVVKQSKDKARDRVMFDVRVINNLREKAEKAGIKDFEWMFEKDALGNMSGNYISELNYAEFDRQFKELNESLDKEYGKHAKGTKATEKIAKRTAWLRENAVSIFGKPQPKDILKWQNPAYTSLSTQHKEILKEFLDIKKKLEENIPDNKRETLRAIQIRKDVSQRIIDSGMSPSTIFNNLKNYYEEAFLDKIDDDKMFGTASRGGLTNFEGHEYMTLPILFTSRLENPNELSTDVFANLMQYAYMARTYSAMDSVIDALETGRDIVKQNRTVNATRGNFPIIEKVKTSVGNYSRNVLVEKSNIEQKLDDFFESQVYGRYLKDSGAFTVLGKTINKNKLVNWALNRSSMAQLGFNWLANTANVLTGVCMQNIEAAAQEYFSAKELAEADLEYTKMLGEFLPELGSRMKQSKLALFDELIDFKGDYRSRLTGVQKKNWMQRIFGENIAFIGQEGGDHWLYNRTAIAMAKRQKVDVPGKGVISLWDALQITDSLGETSKRMYLPPGTKTVDGKPFNIMHWGRQVLHVNQSLFGIYNDDDANAANRVIMGRLLQQYRKWIKPQYNKRFQSAQQSLTMDGKIEEGYYRTLLRICNELVRGQIQLANVWGQLNDSEKANIRRCLTEIVQFWCVYLIASVIEWPDDKDRPWAIKFAEYSARRLQHELGGLNPTSLGLVNEMLKNVKNPVPSLGIVQDMTNLVGSVIDPRDWTDELQSGPYKGMSTLEKNVLKSPFKGIRQYRQISKFTDDIDTSIQYYMRPY